MIRARCRLGTLLVLLSATALSGCAVFGPPVAGPASGTQPRPSGQGRIQPPQSLAQPAPPTQSTPPYSPGVPPPPAREFQLGPAAASLVSIAQGQERSGNYGLAAQTLERALSIEPRNPLVWIALGKESLAAQNPAQAYGMARKALYLAEGDPGVQASAWGLIAASLRAQGQHQAAVAAEQKAAELYPH